MDTTLGESVPTETEDSLTKWVVGVVTLGLVALVGWLSRAMISGVLTQLKEIGTKLDSVAATVAKIDTSTQVHGRDIDRHDGELKAVRERVEGLHEHWTKEFQQLRQELAELRRRN